VQIMWTTARCTSWTVVHMICTVVDEVVRERGFRKAGR
jgi:hypothetical protein